MLPSEKLAIAAHLHVLLRRKTGRVTDVEWLATNAEYANEIVSFAHQKATDEAHPDLQLWADKLSNAFAQMPRKASPLVSVAAQALRTHSAPKPVTPVQRPPARVEQHDFSDSVMSDMASGFMRSTFNGLGLLPQGDPNEPRYVGGLR
jgi:hypothetical protein